MKNYLISVLIENETRVGHRAFTGAYNSLQEAFGSITEMLTKEGWTVASIDGTEMTFPALPVKEDYSEIISQLRWFAAKKKWPKGLEGMPVLLSGAADILQGYSTK